MMGDLSLNITDTHIHNNTFNSELVSSLSPSIFFCFFFLLLALSKERARTILVHTYIRTWDRIGSDRANYVRTYVLAD